MVEHDLAKVGVASSNLVSRSINFVKRRIYISCLRQSNSQEEFFRNLLPKKEEVNSKAFARMAELVDARDLKSLAHCERAGSSPAPGTTNNLG